MIRTKLTIILLLVSLAGGTVYAQTSERLRSPANFRSDGCTLFPDGNYRECCVSHDEDYYFGGSGKERRQSDKRLYKCVKAKRGWQNKIAAPLMWIGVSVGGVPFLPTPFRWGFGKNVEKKAAKKRPETLLRDQL